MKTLNVDMDDALHAAMTDLKKSIDKNTELQETAIAVMQALVEALKANSQELLESRGAT